MRAEDAPGAVQTMLSVLLTGTGAYSALRCMSPGRGACVQPSCSSCSSVLLPALRRLPLPTRPLCTLGEEGPLLPFSFSLCCESESAAAAANDAMMGVRSARPWSSSHLEPSPNGGPESLSRTRRCCEEEAEEEEAELRLRERTEE